MYFHKISILSKYGMDLLAIYPCLLGVTKFSEIWPQIPKCTERC